MLAGNDPAKPAGWVWQQVGVLVSSGELLRLTAAAYNDDGLPEAFLNLDRVLFARIGEPFEVERFEVKLEPGEERAFTMSARMGDHARKRIEIEVYDPAIRQYRTIWFNVSLEDSP